MSGLFTQVAMLLLSLNSSPRDPYDSLVQTLHQNQVAGNTLRVAEVSMQMGFYFYSRKAYDSSQFYFRKSLNLSIANGYDQFIGKDFNNLGIVSKEVGHTDSAIYFYTAGLLAYQQTGNHENAVNTKVNMAILYKDIGLYEESLKLSLEAAQELERSPAGRVLSSCYNTIGLVFARLHNTQQAIHFHRKALMIRKQIGYDRGIAQSYNNIAVTFMESNIYDSALAYFNTALELKQANDDVASTGSTLHNIGTIYLYQGRLEDAEDYLQKALHVKQISSDFTGQTETINSLATMQIKRKNWSKALDLLKTAETNATRLHQLDQLRINYEQQSLVYEKANNLSEAYTYSQKLLAVNDSLLSREELNHIMQLRVQYTEQQARNQIALLEQERNLQKSQLDTRKRWIGYLSLAVIILSILGTLYYRQYQSARKAKEHVQLLLKELNHRVKNNLQILSSIITLQSNEPDGQQAIEALRSSEARINAMAIIHKKFYSEHEINSINAKEYLGELIQYLVYSYGFETKMKGLDVQISVETLDLDKIVPVGLIVNELVSNALKYAYTNQPEPYLYVGLRQSGNLLVLTIEDNGVKTEPVSVGSRKNEEPSFGLKLVNTFVKELKGMVHEEFSEGRKYRIEFPN